MTKKVIFFLCVFILVTQPCAILADYAEDWWNYDYTSYEEAYEDAYNKGYEDAYYEMEDELEQLEKLEDLEDLQEENYQLREENAELQDKLERASRSSFSNGIIAALLMLATIYLVYRLGF